MGLSDIFIGFCSIIKCDSYLSSFIGLCFGIFFVVVLVEKIGFYLSFFWLKKRLQMKYISLYILFKVKYISLFLIFDYYKMPDRDWTWPRWEGSQTGAKMWKCSGSENISLDKRNKTAGCGNHRWLGNWWRNYKNKRTEKEDCVK